LVRPDKISSPITSTAAVTISFAASLFITLRSGTSAGLPLR
jgi:hypothetical protein